MGVICILIGVTLTLYGRVVAIYDSTVRAMAGLAAKGVARFLGFLLTLSGIFQVLAGM